MTTRRDFLLRLFSEFEAERIEYVITRNYAETLDSKTSDVDLLTRPDDLKRLIDCCRRVGLAEGYRLVQFIRFSVCSMAFWGGEEFLRIDVEPGIRWRIFHLLNADEILGERRFVDGMAIPSPEYESVVLLSKVLWMGSVTERYGRQMQELSLRIDDRRRLARLYGRAFGVERDLLSEPLDETLRSRLRSGIFRSTLRNPRRFLQAVSYVLKDLCRFGGRIVSPPGALLQIFAAGEFSPEGAIRKLSVLFPVAKSMVACGKAPPVKAFLCLFRGGLVVELRRARDNADINALVRRFKPDIFSSIRFIGLCEEDKSLHLAHVETGGMQCCASEIDPGEGLKNFAARALVKNGEACQRRGVFAVLVGLDGSGKTTLARKMAEAVVDDPRFAGLHYFHFLPRIWPRREFPFPAYVETSRKPGSSRNFVSSALSMLRLLRNGVVANLGYYLYCAPRLKRGFLVLADRYHLNYWLDPQSVRYTGPDWFLRACIRFFPRPDCLIVLNADKTTLLSRKRELTELQIEEQIRRLSRLPVGFERIDLDAREPAAEVAVTVFNLLAAKRGVVRKADA